jgi:two-component system KDP operon response regulator KdpE
MSEPGGARILLIEDDAAIQRVVTRNLRAHGFDVQVAASAAEGLSAEETFHPDLVLLDLGLPDLDGIEVIHRIRERSSVPIVVLSVRGGEGDKVQALDLGADDYLTKPFGIDELVARVRVGLRHAVPASPDGILRIGELQIDVPRRRVEVSGSAVHLTPTEYGLLLALAHRPGVVMTETALLRRVWGANYAREHHYVHVYMGRLRKKLEADPTHPRVIRTEPGIGYRLMEAESPKR